MNAIKVLWQRQLIKYLRSPARIIGTLGQPLLFLLVFGLGFKSIFEAAGQGSYLTLLAPGIMVMSVVFTAVFSGIEIIWDRQFGFLKETLVAPVTRFSIMFGKTLGGATVALMQGVIIFLVTLLAGFKPQMGGIIDAFGALFMLGALFSAFGIALASKLKDMQAFPIVMNFIVMPLFFLSGAMFPLQGAPRVLEVIANLNPLTYGVDLVRGSLTGIYHFSAIQDSAVLVITTIVIIAYGSYAFSKLEA